MQMQMTLPETVSQTLRELAAECGLLATDFEDFITNRIPVIVNELPLPEEEERVLSEDEFFSIPVANWVSPFISTPATLGEVADKVINDYEGNFENVPDGNRDIAWCNWLQKRWDWEKVGRIETSETAGRIAAGDGNHRRVTLAVLIKSGQTEYRPIPCRVQGFEELSQAAREKLISIAVQKVFDHTFKYIEVDTLLDLPCMLSPVSPDEIVGLRTIREWIDAYRSAHPDNRTPAYRDMKFFLESFDRSRVKFLINADMNFLLWNNSKIDQITLMNRHKLIVSSVIRNAGNREEWQPMPLIPDVFL